MASLKKTMDFTTKQSLVDKDNNFVLVLLASSSAIIIFCLVAANSLYAKMDYQNKVIKARNDAVTQLDTNISNTTSLTNSYQKFESQTPVVKGPTKNSIMTLDALPSKYDFPALVTSLATRMQADSVTVKTITATDQQTTAVQSSPDPVITAMPFTISGVGVYGGAVQKYVEDLENSIRPIVVSNIEFDASSAPLVTLTVKANTYYQPEKIFQIINKDVKRDGTLQ